MVTSAQSPRIRRWFSGARNICWWVLYCIAGVWTQLHFPGIDALLPGLLIAMQEKRWQQIAWVGLFYILIQEGAGSLDFGASLLWYGGFILLFLGGRWFFVTNSLFFVVLLSGAMGMYNVVVMMSLTSLQKLTFPFERLLEQSIVQAMIIPPLWGIAMVLRKKVIRHAESRV